MMRAGKRNRKLTLSRPTSTPNDFGESVETFAAVATVWAEYEPLSDAEQRRASEVGASQNARFRILLSNQVADCDPTWRASLRARGAAPAAEFEIIGVKPCGDLNEGLEISAVARGEKAE